MKGLGGFGKGIRSQLGNLAAPLRGIATRRRNPIHGQRQREIQTRPVLIRRGLRIIRYGETELEARAANDVQGTVWERIVVKELRRRRVQFEFQTASDGSGIPLSVVGYSVDFLILDRPPGIALDVFSGYHNWAFLPLGDRDLTKAATLESNGYAYEVLHAELDIRVVEVFEQRITEILGRIALFG